MFVHGGQIDDRVVLKDIKKIVCASIVIPPKPAVMADLKAPVQKVVCYIVDMETN